MGGVFGGVGLRDQRCLTEMARRLAHRGAGIDIREAADGVFLGCCFDPPEQGIAQLDRYVMAADMAIYNEPGLRAELAGADHGTLDTTAAVVLATYRRFSPAALARINGDFALVVWNDQAEELSFARDYAGSLPLYFAELPRGGVVFASEYKALLAVPEIGTDVDPDMVQYLQNHKYLPSGRTLLKGIRSAPAGAVLTLARNGGAREHGRMPPLACDVDRTSLDASCRKIADAFMEAMTPRAAGRSALGVALSGGIDSISVACACRQINPTATIHTFTAGSGADDPEIRTAELVADRIGASQHSVIVRPQRMAESLGPMVWHVESPIARTEVLQFYELGQAARGVVDLMLTGVVSDGLFAGLPRHKVLWLTQHLPFLRAPLREFYSLTQSGRPPEGLLGKLMDRLYFRGAVPDVPKVNGSQYRPELPSLPPIGQEFINEITCRGLQESIASWLPKVERPLRAAGLRYASPFLDRNFMRVAFTIPSDQKIRLGKEKYVLRRALRQLVPPEVINIPKFPMRMKHDAAFSEALDDVADRVLTRERVARRGLMAYAEIRRLRERGPGHSYSSEGAMRLWTALLTEIWAETFLDLRGERPVTSTPAGS